MNAAQRADRRAGHPRTAEALVKAGARDRDSALARAELRQHRAVIEVLTALRRAR